MLKDVSLSSSGTPSYIGFTQILKARQSLASCMARAWKLEAELSKVERRMSEAGERLLALDSAIRPLHTKSYAAKALTYHVNDAIANISSLLQSFHALHATEKALTAADLDSDARSYLSLVDQLPQSLQHLRSHYESTITCVDEVIHYLWHSRACDKYHVHTITEMLLALKEMEPRIDMGLSSIVAEKLTPEFQRTLLQLLASDHARDHLDKGLIIKLQQIATRLVANGKAHDCLAIYTQIRVKALRESQRSLEAVYLKHLTAPAIESLDWGLLEGYLELWIKHIPLLVKGLFAKEMALCSQIFVDCLENTQRLQCFGQIVQRSNILLFLQFGELVALSGSQPEKLFKFLDMYEVLDNLKRDIGEVFEGDECLEIRMRFWELQKQLAHIASVILWEFGKRLVDTEKVAPPQNGSSDRICSYVVNYLLYLVDMYGPIADKLFKGLQNWGDNRMEGKNLSFAVQHSLQALEKNLEDRARQYYQDNALKHIFLMNSYWYMCNKIRNSELGTCVGGTWLRDCKRKVEQNALRYNREGWEKILMHLSREGLQVSSGGRGMARDLIKQRLQAFNAAFEETYYKSCKWSIPDENLRKETQLTVIQLLLPAYSSFIEQYRKIIGEIPGINFLKYSPAVLESLLGDLFQNKPGKLTIETRNGHNLSI